MVAGNPLPFCLGLWRGPSTHPLASPLLHAHHHLSHAGPTEACHLLPGPGEALYLAVLPMPNFPLQPWSLNPFPVLYRFCQLARATVSTSGSLVGSSRPRCLAPPQGCSASASTSSQQLLSARCVLQGAVGVVGGQVPGHVSHLPLASRS